MHAELVNPEKVILEEIAIAGMTRDSIALTYAFCLRQLGPDNISFRKINSAILDRWAFSSLDYIKSRAWGIYEGRIKI